MAKSIHAIMVYKKPDGPLVHCKVLEIGTKGKAFTFAEGLKMTFYYAWYSSIRYSAQGHYVETAGFGSIKALLDRYPECEKFITTRQESETL
jgi:hypothetical protein